MLSISICTLSRFRRRLDAFADVFTDRRNVDSFEALVSVLIIPETNWTLTLLGIRLLSATGIEINSEESKPAAGTATVHAFVGHLWLRRSLGGLLALVALATIAVWAAEHVAYAEQLDSTVALTGAAQRQ